MNKDQKLRVLELSQGKTTQKKMAEDVGATIGEVRSFLREFRENPIAITLELNKSQSETPEEPRPISLYETLKKPLRNNRGDPAIVMNPAVAALPPKRSTNSSKFEDAIFRPRKK